MDSEAIIDLNRRVDNLEAQVRALADHLKIVLLYNPQKYEVMTKEQLEKDAKLPTVGR